MGGPAPTHASPLVPHPVTAVYRAGAPMRREWPACRSEAAIVIMAGRGGGTRGDRHGHLRTSRRSRAGPPAARLTTGRRCIASSADARNSFVDILRLDLVGPRHGGEHGEEILSISPSRRCLKGFLVPCDARGTRRSDGTGEDQLDLRGRGDGGTTRSSAIASRAVRSAVTCLRARSCVVRAPAARRGTLGSRHPRRSRDVVPSGTSARTRWSALGEGR